MKIRTLIYNIGIGAVLTTGLTACGSDWLDVSPSDGVPADGALKNSATLESARVGLYKALKGTSDMSDYYGRNMFVYGEVRGEDMQHSIYGSNRADFYYKMEYSTANDFSRGNSVWQSPYVVVSRANRIIEANNLSDASSNAATINRIKAEARVLRALAIFDVTRVYGKPYLQDNGASWGAALSTQTLNPAAKVKRSTVAECYTFVENELKAVIASGALSTEKTEGYVNQWFAKGLLSRVYLTKGDYANALTLAKDVIDNSPYQLWTRDQYVHAWYKDDVAHGNEMLFEIAVTGFNDWNDREGYPYLVTEDTDRGPSGYGDMVITKAFSDALLSDANDIRNNIVAAPTSQKVVDANTFLGRKVYLRKFIGSTTQTDPRYSNVPLMRLSEVYLNAAEAAFKLGNMTDAATYLNAIISHRTTSATTVTASSITADRIYMERRKELVGEGHRYFDALRRGETITRYTNATNQGWHQVLNADVQSFNTWTFKKELPLIPSMELNGNDIQQNPSY